MSNLSARYVDTCLPCYLLDAHNRPGETLMFCSLGQDKEETIKALIDSIDPDDWEPGGLNRYNEPSIKKVIRTAIKGVDLRYIDANGNPCDEPPENRDAEEPYLYVLLEWIP